MNLLVNAYMRSIFVQQFVKFVDKWQTMKAFT